MTNDFVFTANQPLCAPGGSTDSTKGAKLPNRRAGLERSLSPKTRKIQAIYAARANASPRLSWQTHRATFYPKEGQIWMSPKLSPAGSGLNVNLRLVAWEPFIAPLTWDWIALSR